MNTAFRVRLLIGTLAVAAIMLVSVPSQAQLLGQVSTARTLERGANDVGGYLGLFEDFTTVFGQYRHGLSGNLDFGLQGGIVDPDVRGADAGLIIGGDLKWMVMSAGADPFDMALDARASLYDISNVSVFSVGGLVLISRDYRLSQGSNLSPYGGVNIRIDGNSILVEGPPLEAGFESFVGRFAGLPVRHGLTAGELARWFHQAHGVGEEPLVVTVDVKWAGYAESAEQFKYALMLRRRAAFTPS